MVLFMKENLFSLKSEQKIRVHFCRVVLCYFVGLGFAAFNKKVISIFIFFQAITLCLKD